jgi:hypothetical protein
VESRAERSSIAVAALALVLACARPPPPELPAPVPPAVPEAAAPAPAAPCLRIERILVHKGERRLFASCQGGALVALPVALGREPEGAKRASGDHRTPEGTYRVAGPAQRSQRFHRFVPIDYPSPADAARALAEGRLSRRDHARILAAHRKGVLPPQDTPLGGGLGFHGEGERWRGDSQHLDWTYGCIALADADLDFVIGRIAVGTPVTILAADAPLPAQETQASQPTGAAAPP